MVCIYCGGETQVTNSRAQKRNNQVWRRRRCQACGALFTTLESIDLASALMVTKDGVPTPFLTDLLFTEVLLALQDRKNLYLDASEVTATIIKNLLRHPAKPLYSPSDISKITADVLQAFDKRAWHRYAAEHPSTQ